MIQMMQTKKWRQKSKKKGAKIVSSIVLNINK